MQVFTKVYKYYELSICYNTANDTTVFLNCNQHFANFKPQQSQCVV